MSKLKTPKGAISILLTILILSVVLVIAFGISSVLLRQIKMSGQTSDSVRAYQAADSGIEYALNQVKGGSPIPDGKICDNWTPVDSGSYCLEITAGDQTNPEGIKSIGKAGQAQRAVEVAMAQAGTGCYVSYVDDGTCLAGFTNMGSLGTWGFCHNHTNNETYFPGVSSHFRPPGATCSIYWQVPYNLGTAYLCCQ